MGVLKEFALIVAGGYGKRMGSELPKQFIQLGNKPLLMHTLEAFLEYSNDLIIIVVLPFDQIDYWKKLCKDHEFTHAHLIQEGGDTRFQSVKKGLGMIDDEGLVAIHDGVRPFVNREVISSSFRVAERKGSGICAIHLKDSLRKIEGENSFPVNRDEYMAMQTPQTFRVSLIKKAYQTIAENDSLTDDASVLEAAGMNISLVEGNPMNFKITTPDDLRMAASIIASK